MISCSGHRTRNAEAEDSRKVSTVSRIEMPMVPDTLTDPADRADYLLDHFWDSVDFTDRRVLSDSVMIEQGISDFISVMDFCSQEGLEKGIRGLLDKASSASPEAYERITALARRYLWEAESPFRSERLYTPFVKYAISLGGDEAVMAGAILDDIRRNAPGSVAPGFTVTGRDGRDMTLASQLGGECPVALMFYEPDCDHCEEALASLTSNQDIERLIASGQLRFIAVYIGEEYDKWKEHAEGLPKSWNVGIDRKRVIDERELYIVGATPSFYLIGADGRILMKDSGLGHFYRMLLEGY